MKLKTFLLVVLFLASFMALAFATDLASDGDQENQANNSETELDLPKSLDLSRLLPASLNFNPQVGSFCKYLLQDKVKRKSREFTIAVSKKGDLPDSYWLEISTMSEKETSLTFAVLLIKQQKSYKISRFIIRIGDHPAIEAPLTDITPKKINHDMGSFKKIGAEKLTVKAGSFMATRFKHTLATGDVQQIWSDERVLPFGLIRSISITDELELLAYGTDYVAHIDKEPIKIESTKEAELKNEKL